MLEKLDVRERERERDELHREARGMQNLSKTMCFLLNVIAGIFSFFFFWVLFDGLKEAIGGLAL